MMKTFKTAKIAAGLVGFAIAVSFVVAPVTTKAQTTAELTAQINALLAQIAALQAQVGGGASASATFNTDLTVGSTGADVVALQTFLESHGFLVMPAGVAKGTFGPLTKAGVAAYQTARGITPAAGFFGPITRARVNSEMGTMTGGTGSTGTSMEPGCTSTSGFSPVNGHPCNGSMTGGTTGGTTGTLHGGAGDITLTARTSGTESQVIEGDSNVKVLGFDIKPTGSDVNVTSVRVELEHTGSSGSTRLTRYADKVSIMQNGHVLGSADASAFSKSSDIYSYNIPVTGGMVSQDQTTRFYVAIDANNTIDTNDTGTDWEVGLGQVRFNDATGAILTDSTGTGVGGSITQTFTFEKLSTAGNVKLTVNEDDQSVNDAHTVQVDATSDTNAVPILSFSIKAADSDLHLMSLPFDITSSGAGVTEIANDFHLLMDGHEVGTVTIDNSNSFASSTDTTRTLTITNLDDDNVVVHANDTVNFELQADVNDTGGAFTNGDSLSVTLDSANITNAEDQNGDTVTDTTGTADSSNISFASTGIMLAMGADDTAVVHNNDTTPASSYGTYEVNFDVTAFEDTVWVALTASNSTSTSASTAGAEFYMEIPTADDSGLGGTGTTSGVLERVSGGTTDGNYVRINAGETAHLRLTATYDPAVTGDFRAQLHAVNFATTKAAGTTQQLAVPTSDYQSPSAHVVNS